MVVLMNCGKCENNQKPEVKETEEFKYFIEQFADIKIGRFQIPGFDELTLKQKEMLYYLYEAALCGRDIIWDQNYKHNLKVRRTLEEIYKHYKGDRAAEDFNKFEIYTKRVWFSNGIHHHYSTSKFLPEFSKEFFAELVKNSPDAKFPLAEGEKLEDFIAFMTPVMFDPDKDAKRVCTDPTKDLVQASANNYYDNVTEKEVEGFYKSVIKKDDPTPVSYGLNSRLTKENGKIVEKVWKVGGLYGEAIEKIVFWLKKASAVAENDVQKKALDLLIEYYETGDLKTFDDYSIAWTNDTDSRIDVVNGFIETYGDPLSFRASYESVVSFRDEEATKRTKIISDNAQWFEQNSPIADEHKRKEVKGVSAKVITVVALGGDTAPNPPIGINLPNANWIRGTHGSKSVTMGNITHAYEKVSEGSGLLEEFAYSDEEAKLAREFGGITGDLHTDMHEIIGHGSGQINPGVGTPKETLKSYSSVIEEARADLVALYYFMDPKLVELGLIPSLDAGKAEYSRAIRNGMVGQLIRIKLGDIVEQTHMRNRQMIAKWAMVLGKEENVVEKKVKDGKTYFVVNDYQKLRGIFGKMLKEIQRIKSEGDYDTAKKLVETYAVKIDYDLHKEILERYEKLKVAPYSGFIMPRLVAVEENGKVTDVKVEYPMDFAKQMLYFAEKYSFLPTVNN
jgi:dipeptidyl-peptidase-3